MLLLYKLFSTLRFDKILKAGKSLQFKNSCSNFNTHIRAYHNPRTTFQLFRSKKSSKMSGEQMTCKGTLRGHNGWITQIATTPVFPDMLLSASRDKTIIMWQLTREEGYVYFPLFSIFELYNASSKLF